MQLKLILSVVLLLDLCVANANIDFTIIDPCTNTPIYKTKTAFTQKTTVAELTLQQLKKSKIPFAASEIGVQSIAQTPSGLDSNEVISNSHMRTYGWCYKVNSLMSTQLANEFILNPAKNYQLLWFYGYAEYSNGTWNDDFCEPLYLHSKQFICNTQ